MVPAQTASLALGRSLGRLAGENRPTAGMKVMGTSGNIQDRVSETDPSPPHDNTQPRLGSLLTVLLFKNNSSQIKVSMLCTQHDSSLTSYPGFTSSRIPCATIAGKPLLAAPDWYWIMRVRAASSLSLAIAGLLRAALCRCG